MNTLLERLGGFAARRHWIVIIAWLIILGGLIGAMHQFGGEFLNDYTVPGSGSSDGLNLLNSDYPQQGGYGGQIVFHARHGTVAQQEAAVNQATSNVAGLPHVLKAASPFASPGTGAVSKDGTIAYSSVSWKGNPAGLTTSYLNKLNKAVSPARKAGLAVEYGGAAGEIGQQTSDTVSEVIGLACALLLLGVAGTRGIASVTPASVNKAATVAVFNAVPTSSPQAKATVSLVRRVRDDVLPAYHATSYVTGTTAGNIDFTDQISSRMLILILAVVAIAFVLLTMAFRSVVIATKAAIMNLLSIGAAYGVIVAIFQWGWGASLIGVHTTSPIPAYVPMMMFAIVFGLSMDYEVFLLSRVHESWIATDDAHRSVAIGIGSTARVITTAAGIMVVVFSSFLLNDQAAVKMLAIGMAVAVLIDASIVRMILVPAIMALLGKRAWWMPHWMERIVPQLQLEGSTAAAAGAAPAAHGVAAASSRRGS